MDEILAALVTEHQPATPTLVRELAAAQHKLQLIAAKEQTFDDPEAHLKPELASHRRRDPLFRPASENPAAIKFAA